MDLRLLETVYWIAKLGSFGAAAEHLHVSQPAISNRVKELETVLEGQLFDRTMRHAKLTPLGSEILPSIEQMMSLVANIRSAASSDKQRVRGMVRLGMSQAAAKIVLPELISEIGLRYPDIDIEFDVDISATLIARLQSRQLDVILASGSVDSFELHSEYCRSFHLSWISSPTLDIGPEPISPQSIANHRIITYGKSGMMNKIVSDAFREHGICPPHINRTNSLAAMVQLALAGRGICITAMEAVADYLAERKLRLLDVGISFQTFDCYVSYRRNQINNNAQCVAEIIMSVCERQMRDSKRKL